MAGSHAGSFQFTALLGLSLSLAAIIPIVDAVSSQAYTWNNVKIGGGGGFVPGIVRHPPLGLLCTKAGSNDAILIASDLQSVGERPGLCPNVS